MLIHPALLFKSKSDRLHDSVRIREQRGSTPVNSAGSMPLYDSSRIIQEPLSLARTLNQRQNHRRMQLPIEATPSSDGSTHVSPL